MVHGVDVEIGVAVVVGVEVGVAVLEMLGVEEVVDEVKLDAEVAVDEVVGAVDEVKVGAVVVVDEMTGDDATRLVVVDACRRDASDY